MSYTDGYGQTDSGTYSKADQQRRLAQLLAAQASSVEPIASGWQGAAKLAQALAGVLGNRAADKREAAQQAQLFRDLALGMSGGGGGATVPDAGPATTGSISGGGGGGGIGSDFAASMTPEEAIVRTVAGEAAGEPAEGQAAVASVILNRAKQSGQSPQAVVLAKNQFEPWSRNPQRLMALTRDSPKYQQILANIQPALQGQDVTGGATHFYAPRAQAALGRNTPGWARGPYQDIGNHRFFKLAGGPTGQPETAALPGVVPVAAAPSPGVMNFLGGGGQQAQPAGLQIGPPDAASSITGADPRQPQARPPVMPQPRPAPPPAMLPLQPPTGQPMPPPPAPGVPAPPIQPPAPPITARAATPPSAAQPMAGPQVTGSIAPQQRGQIFREPYPSVLSAQEFARQGQNYLTGRPSFANQQRVAPRTMQEPVAGMAGGVPAGSPAAAPASPRQGLIQRLLGGGAGGAGGAAQAAPAGSAVAGTGQPVDARRAALIRVLANPNAAAALKVLAAQELKGRDPTKYGFTTMPDGTLVRTNPDTGAVEPTGVKGAKRDIQNDANGVPRYTDTGEPVYPGDTGTGGQFFSGKSVEAQGLNYLLDQGKLTKEQAANIAAGKTVTGADGSIYFMTPHGLVVQNPDGATAGGDGVQISGPKTYGTEAETKAAGFADRMGASGATITELEQEGTAIGNALAGKAGLVGTFWTTPEGKQYLQAKEDWINAQLRRESGAVIGASEFASADRQYFPQPNDDPQTIENKRQSRALAEQGMVRSAGPLYKPAKRPEKPAPGKSMTNPVSIGTQADYDRLPSGAYYVDDDGSIKVKN